MDIQQIISSRRRLDRVELYREGAISNLFGELMNRDQPVAMHTVVLKTRGDS